MGADEQQLIRRILSGNTDEYSYFVDRYGREVFAVAVRLLGNVQEAEEVAQDAFVSAFQHLADYRPEYSFATWVCRMAYNGAISLLRKRSRSPVKTDIDERRLAAVTDEMASTMLGEGDDDRMALLERALDRLPAEEQTLVELFYKEEKTLKEIAYILGMKGDNARAAGTLATKICRIRKKLYVIIKQMEESV